MRSPGSRHVLYPAKPGRPQSGVAALIAAYDDRLDEIPEDLLIVAEAAVITMNVAQGAKCGFARERPDVTAFTVPIEVRVA